MKGSYFCVDIGTNSIRAIERSPDGTVLRWGVLERSIPFHMNISKITAGDAGPALSELVGRIGGESMEAIAIIPSFYFFTTVVDSPDPGYIPAEISTYKIRSFLLPDGRYFLAAIPKDVIEEYKKTFVAAGLKLTDWEMESIELAKNFSAVSKRAVIINSDERSTTYVVADKGVPEFVYHSDFSMSSGAPDVIMNKAREIALKKGVKTIFFSNSIFNGINGLQKVS